MEVGYGLTSDGSHSRPADVMAARWDKILPAACLQSPTNILFMTQSVLSYGGSVSHWW